MNIPTYTTSTAIHTAQFSSTLRVIIHCATRLVVAVAESTYGSAASVKRAKSVAEHGHADDRDRGERERHAPGWRATRLSSVRFSPP